MLRLIIFARVDATVAAVVDVAAGVVVAAVAVVVVEVAVVVVVVDVASEQSTLEAKIIPTLPPL